MSSNSRTRILDGAMAVLNAGGTVSLDSAAKQIGLSKPGVMYHFPTKEALMVGLIDHVADAWEGELLRRLPVSAEHASPRERHLAYLRWVLDDRMQEAERVLFADPRLREQSAARWVERLGAWLDLPGDLDPAERDRLTAVRLMADGVCYADTLGIHPLDTEARERLRAFAETLLEKHE